MADITIQQTLKIVDGRLSPSTSPIDGDLVEISKQPDNAIEIKEDGLYVAVVKGSETTPSPSEGTFKDVIVRDVASNGSYTDKLSSSKTLALTTRIPPELVDSETGSLRNPYVINVDSYGFKDLFHAFQTVHSLEGKVSAQPLEYSVEKTPEGFIKEVKIPSFNNLINPKVVPLAGVQVENTSAPTTPSLYQIVPGMKSFSGYAPGSPDLVLEVNGEEMTRFKVGYYYFTQLVPYTFKTGDVVTIKIYDDADTFLGESTLTVPTTNLTFDRAPLVDETTFSGTYIPNSTFYMRSETTYESYEVVSDEAGQWSFTRVEPFKLNEIFRFTTEGFFGAVQYVEDNPDLDLSVEISLTLEGVVGNVSVIEDTVTNTFEVDNFESLVSTPVLVPEEYVTHRYKIKQDPSLLSKSTITLGFLKDFKKIVSCTVTRKIEGRTLEGNNILNIEVLQAPLQKNGETWTTVPTVAGDSYQIKDLYLIGYEVGSTLITCPNDLNGKVSIAVDGVDYYTAVDYDNKLSMAQVPELQEGQLIKATLAVYKPNDGIYEVVEYVEYVVGSDNPVLTVLRPPHVDYSEDLGYFEIEVKGVLK